MSEVIRTKAWRALVALVGVLAVAALGGVAGGAEARGGEDGEKARDVASNGKEKDEERAVKETGGEADEEGKRDDGGPGKEDEAEAPGRTLHEPDMKSLLGQISDRRAMRSIQARWSAFRKSQVTWNNRGVGRVITFTFDDGPSQVVTPLVMDKLEKEGLKGTFFVNGRRFGGGSAVAAKNKEVLVEAVRRGHYIGNHTQSHPMLKNQSASRQKWEVLTTHNAIARVTGLRTYLYRPPFGGQTSYTRRLLRRAGYATVMWNLSSNDPFGRHVAKVHRTVMRKVTRDHGGIVLMHDTNPWSACAIPLIVRSILIESCKLVRRGEEPYLIVGPEHFRIPPGEKTARPTPAAQLEASLWRAKTMKFCGLAPDPKGGVGRVASEKTGEAK